MTHTLQPLYKPDFINRNPVRPAKVAEDAMVVWQIYETDPDGIPYESLDEKQVVASGVGYLKRAVWLSGEGYDLDQAIDYLASFSEVCESYLEPETWIYLVQTLTSNSSDSELTWFDEYQIYELTDPDAKVAKRIKQPLPNHTFRVHVHYPFAGPKRRIIDLGRPRTLAFLNMEQQGYPHGEIMKAMSLTRSVPNVVMDITLMNCPFRLEENHDDYS